MRGAVDVPDRHDFAATARAIGDAGGPAVYAGYSMGARLCLRLALDRPDLVHALVLVSGTPGIEDGRERAARVESDERWAERAEQADGDTFLHEWLAQPMFATVPADAPGLADRRSLTPAFLAACLRRLGTGAMEPMWDRLADLTIPVLLVTGTRDAKFTAIAQRMLERLPAGAVHRADRRRSRAAARAARGAGRPDRRVRTPARPRPLAQAQADREQRGEHQLVANRAHERADQ